MSDLLIQRITSQAGALECDELFVEYMQWLIGELNLIQPVDYVTQEPLVNAAFREEWPQMLSDQGRMYLITDGTTKAGVVALHPRSQTEAEVKRMYVRPDHRGKGLSRVLLDRLVEDSRLIGYSTVVLESLVFMKSAHSLYESAGFEYVNAFDGHEGQSHGVTGLEVFMRLELAS